MARSSHLEQLTSDLIQLGRIVAVDHGQGTCAVELGDLVTGDLPWLAPRAGAVRVWSPPSVGEQCLVLCPEGDLANGVVLPGLWSDAFPAPSADPDTTLIEFADGAVIAYDAAAHVLSATLPAAGTATLHAPGGATIIGDVAIQGNVTLTGKLTASEDVVGGGVSLKGHRHTAVQPGGGQSGAPL